MAQQTVNVLVLASIYLLFSLGLSLVWGSFNILNLAHGSVFMLGAFAAYLLTEHMSLSIWALVPLGFAVGAAAAIVLEIVAFRHLRNRGNRTIHGGDMVIASIAASIIPISIAENVTHLAPFTAKTTFVVHSYEPLGVRIANLDIAIVLLAVGLTTALSAWVRRSRAGQAVRALAVDPVACELAGVNQARLGLLMMALSGGLAGLAGVLLMLHLGSVTADIGNPLLLKAFAIIVVGSVGSIWGAALGSLLLATVETVLILHGWGQWQDAVSFSAVVLILLVRPDGLLAGPRYRRV
jgi:branched-chain amino acid transport system permease protein